MNDDRNLNETPEQRARRLGVPLVRQPNPLARRYDPNPVVAVCGECGRDVRWVEHHSCGRVDCPFGSALL